VIGLCSLVPTSHWLQEKSARINLSQAASSMIITELQAAFGSIFSVKITALGSFMRATERIFKISI